VPERRLNLIYLIQSELKAESRKRKIERQE
jgi:hypothetical protein